MKQSVLYVFVIVILCFGCANGSLSLENASVKYKRDRDHASLKIIHENLAKDMQRKEVERLLGEADYSPIEGQYYYSSSRSEKSEVSGGEMAIGLVVDYRDTNGHITERLWEFWMGPVGE